MNKKDLKMMGKAPETPDRALWRATYAALVGGHVGGLLARVPTPERFENQLETLARIADAAVNCAIRRGSLDENQGVKAAERG